MRVLGKALLITFALIGFLSVLITVGIIYAASSFLHHADQAKGDSAPERFVIVVDLDQPYPESVSDPLEAALNTQGPTLHQAVAAIDQAAQDPHVAGLLATLSGVERSLADAQSLRDAVLRFRATGKPTLLFSPALGESGHGTVSTYIASAFETIWLQPSGSVSITGLGAEVPFFQKALQDIGVQADYGRRWEYKTALDSAIDQSMSEAHRASLTRLLESWQGQIADGLAERPRLDREAAMALLTGPPLLAEDALEAGVVDHLGYWDQAEDHFLDQSGAMDMLPLDDYPLKTPKNLPKAEQIALISVDGMIARKGPDAFGSGPPDSDALAQAVSEAAEDPETRAIVLRVNSPGGSYVASDTLRRELVLARERGLPVIVSMGTAAASGGYFIALPATKIVAQPGTITGSIGVFGFKPVLQGLWDKLGVHWEEVSLSPYASMYSSNQPFTDTQRAVFEKSLDAVYDDFTKKVSEARGMDMDMIDKVARGRVWTGRDAYKVGLVDTLGGLDEAIAVAKEEAGYPRTQPLTIRSFPEPMTPLDALLDAFNLGDLGKAARILSQVNSLSTPLRNAATQAQISSQGPALLAPPLGQ